MRRIVISVVLLAGVLTLATAGLADPGGKGKAKKAGHNRFSAQVIVPDNGTCQNVWATDTSTRTWSVKKHGKFRGYLSGTVSGGTFNPAATCAAACIGDTKAFIAAFFPGGTFTCSLGYAGCKFNFEYSSPDKSLVFHHWQDKGTNGVSEQFTGDIANS